MAGHTTPNNKTLIRQLIISTYAGYKQSCLRLMCIRNRRRGIGSRPKTRKDSGTGWRKPLSLLPSHLPPNRTGGFLPIAIATFQSMGHLHNSRIEFWTVSLARSRMPHHHRRINHDSWAAVDSRSTSVHAMVTVKVGMYGRSIRWRRIFIA